jgi:CheY-like chemotaxis protein
MERHILHVEDNPDDAMLLALAFRKAGIAVQLKVVTSGEQAMAALLGGEPLPACVLLDNKLDGKSGLEVLTWIRAHSELRHLPVVVLTSSSDPNEIDLAYEGGANSYLVKPADLESLVELVKTIDQYWLRTNAGPIACILPAAGGPRDYLLPRRR